MLEADTCIFRSRNREKNIGFNEEQCFFKHIPQNYIPTKIPSIQALATNRLTLLKPHHLQ